MLSKKQIRATLKDSTISDIEIESLRNLLYDLARAVLDNFENKQNQQQTKDIHLPSVNSSIQFEVASARFTENEQEALDERAAILEIDAGLSRDEAERKTIANRLGMM